MESKGVDRNPTAALVRLADPEAKTHSNTDADTVVVKEAAESGRREGVARGLYGRHIPRDFL